MNPNSQDFHSLGARVDRLERQNATWKRATWVFALVSASLILIAARADRTYPNVIHARTVEAEDFIVRDLNGQIRARLSLYPFREGNRRLSVPPLAAGPILQIYAENGDPIWTAPEEPAMVPVK